MSQTQPVSNAALEALDRVRRMGSVQVRYTGSYRRVPSGIREPVYSAAGQDPRDPQKLSNGLEELLKKRGWTSSVDVGSLLGNWPQLVGENIAQHCVPELCEPPKLTVRASTTTWATQLRLMSTMLLDKLEQKLGRRVIDDIEIIGPKQKSWKKGRRSVHGRGPRDTYG